MTTVAAPSRPAYDELSISSLDFWSVTAEERDKTFKVLREQRPVSWHRPLEGSLMPPENDGVWVVTSHELVREVSRKAKIFCSSRGFQFEEVPEDILSAAGSFLGMDDPRHAKLRRLVSTAFTPKQVASIHEQIRNQARIIVDDLLAHPEGDFVSAVSKKLPMWTIYEMVGLEDQEARELAAHHADGMVSWADENVAAGRESGEVLNDALVGLLEIGFDLADQRRTSPRNDLMTNLVQAEVDGEQLTDEEIASFFVLLSVAGNDTTRNSISLTAKAFQDFPDQRELLLADFDNRIEDAVEEAVRFATPVMTFRRTATQDVELGGQFIREGDWVAIIYSSANRDEKVFAHPDRFDILRSPNPHLGFGGGGPHNCMGNFVARSQLREIFRELLHRAPTLRVGEPEYLTGNFVRAVKSMPYTL
ncbi:cytochrome P450 [Gordonia sp. (in: high G+C Gram-positive bacteria)]|jgi:cytochrome P450|uniref:cytochrome P450 n=1 Tax=Gordonia sp. (in: high G+C Gram-positive bacteria) TaxID=84139 RepID=UPI001DF2319A|nr:cytochrome P450 [Gordonia sp. (in: high G+C Gram-positive bacteria)]MCB1297284.1 cytochrome P450 [Gordonia sp. (in: high G+C Gram-positive bacteria)]HMS77590.1 cytochrome P450 [Gordonia sp. (in: high G+C Gram-positive bacteria)]HQV18262.1 cytochrome P450 [Gordonia sp. (in: high G+C Gram-positive bacteria)]